MRFRRALHLGENVHERSVPRGVGGHGAHVEGVREEHAQEVLRHLGARTFGKCGDRGQGRERVSDPARLAVGPELHHRRQKREPGARAGMLGDGHDDLRTAGWIRFIHVLVHTVHPGAARRRGGRIGPVADHVGIGPRKHCEIT